jgi:hypothetical protein
MTDDSGAASGEPRLTMPETSAAVPSELYRAFMGVTYYGEVIAMVQFHRKTGERFAKPYHWLGHAGLNPSEGITLVFTDIEVELRGRNLASLFAALCDYGVRLIREADSVTALLVPESEPLVERIDCRPSRLNPCG